MLYDVLSYEFDYWKAPTAKRKAMDRLVQALEKPNGTFPLAASGKRDDDFSMAVSSGLRLILMRADPAAHQHVFIAAETLLGTKLWCSAIATRISLDQSDDFIGRLFRSTRKAFGQKKWVEILKHHKVQFGSHDWVNEGLWRLLEENFDAYLKSLSADEYANADIVAVLSAKKDVARLAALKKAMPKAQDHLERLLSSTKAESSWRNREPRHYYSLIEEDVRQIKEGTYFSPKDSDDHERYTSAEAAAKGFDSASWKAFEKDPRIKSMNTESFEEDQKKRIIGFETSVTSLRNWVTDLIRISPYRRAFYSAPSIVQGSWHVLWRNLIEERRTKGKKSRQFIEANALVRSCNWPCGWAGKYPEGGFKVFHYPFVSDG